MVGTMLPIGYGERKTARVSKSIASYAFGCALGSAALGLFLGSVGSLIGPPLGPERFGIASAATAAVALVYGLSDASLLRVPRMESRRQVPLSWYRRFRPPVAGLLYGATLGVGFVTRLSVSTFYILPLWAFLGGDVVRSGLVLTAFGVGRFLPLLLIGSKKGANGDALDVLITRIDELQPLVTLANGLMLEFIGGYLLVATLALL
jgi:hypothetical protein